MTLMLLFVILGMLFGMLVLTLLAGQVVKH
jgi:hypothetical protein